GDFDALKHNFDVEATGIAGQVSAAAQVYADVGGISGFLQHRQADIKKAVKYLREHGFDLNMISDLLGSISSLLSLAALIPGLQILGVIATAAALVKLAVDLVLVVAGEKSFGSFALGAALTLIPFGLRGAGAAVMKGGSTATRGVVGSAVKGNTLLGNARLLGRAQSYQKSLTFTKRIDWVAQKANLGTRGLKGHTLVVGGQNALRGAAAESAAWKVVDLSRGNTALNVVSTTFDYSKKAYGWYERGKKVVEFSERFSHDDKAGSDVH
ncbi:MAG: hypothetical protein WCC60_24120, partial [Ilumatobacteraceae bacterium]